ncbi:MAG: hypothetical protein CVV17_03075, partial [Gammaproteobacteria bacterium HGW-Gammaproteobacteria-7]
MMDIRPAPYGAAASGTRNRPTTIALALCLTVALIAAPLARAQAPAAEQAQSQTTQPADAPTLSALAASPQFGQAQLSPDGRHIAVVRIAAEGNTLVILDADSLQAINELKFSGRQNVIHFSWANDQTLVVSRGTPLDGFGQPRTTGELYAVSLDGKQRRYLFGYKADRSARNRGRNADQALGWVIDRLPNSPSEVLVGAIDWSEDST